MKRANNIYSMITFLIITIMAESCVPIAANYRREGFSSLQKAFESYGVANNINMVVELKNVKIHIVSNRRYFPWEKAAAYGSPVVGYATSGNEIYIFGKKIGDKIFVNQAVLGHELNHLLNYKSEEIANPDDLEMLEICQTHASRGKKC